MFYIPITPLRLCSSGKLKIPTYPGPRNEDTQQVGRCPTYGYRVLFLITSHITSNLSYILSKISIKMQKDKNFNFPLPFVICTYARSGSNFLMSLLNNTGIVTAGEFRAVVRPEGFRSTAKKR